MPRVKNDAENMMTVIEEKVEEISTERLILDKDSQEVTMYISGYIAKKLLAQTEKCCGNLLIGDYENKGYLKALSRGGLLTPSEELGDYVSCCFSILEEVLPTIMKNKLPAREAALCFLKEMSLPVLFVCEKHSEVASSIVNKTCSNIFLNNERKRKSATVI